MIDRFVAADVVLGVLKDVTIGLVGGLLLTMAVLCIEALVARWRRT